MLSVNLIVLLLPVAAVFSLHLYENELIRQTESILMSQGALVATTFRNEVLRTARKTGTKPEGHPLNGDSPFFDEEALLPIQAGLDVAKGKIFPPASDGIPVEYSPDAVARTAGQIMEPILHQAKRFTLCGTRIVDSLGIVVASSGIEKNLSLIGRQEVRSALEGNYAALLRQRISDEPVPPFTSISRRTNIRVFVAVPVVNHGTVLGAVILSRSPVSMGKGLYLIRTHLFKAALVLVVTVIVFSIITTFMISSPIKALIRQTEQVKRGEADAAAPLEHPGTVEVAGLSEAIVQMAKSLEQRAEYIKTFARSVSHEFKTPLTSLKGTVELLASYGDEMSGKEHKKFLQNMEGDINRLDQMVRRLLDLAKADVIQPGTDHCDINMVFCVLEKRYADTGKVIFNRNDAPTEIKMHGETLETVLVNLIENSLQHGGQNTDVTLSARLGTRNVEVFVSDTGKGISTANRDKIFRLFFTTAMHTGGSGLGLAIVQSLLAAHNGSIELLPEEKTTFKITMHTD